MGRRIAVLDYNVVPTNPIGGCLWQMLRGLCHEHEFTVFWVLPRVARQAGELEPIRRDVVGTWVPT